MQTIVVISQDSFWKKSQKTGEYTQSTIESTLGEVGFIHCTTPEQTIMIAKRHFTQYDDLTLLLIDLEKVKPEVKFEASLSGRGGIYPHIYGPLNMDAIYKAVPLAKDNSGEFITPTELLPRIGQSSN
jgi:uncharacterized protein (DUF952 family)